MAISFHLKFGNIVLEKFEFLKIQYAILATFQKLSKITTIRRKVTFQDFQGLVGRLTQESFSFFMNQLLLDLNFYYYIITI